MMEYATLFSAMGTVLIYFALKSFVLRKRLEEARELIVGIALDEVDVRVNRKTKEIDIKWRESK